MTDWIEALRAECARTSQARTAKRVGISTATISQILKGAYPHDTGRVEARVRGELMRATVLCPVLGDISSRDCDDHQQRPFAATNPTRVQLYKACRSGCKHSRIGGCK